MAQTAKKGRSPFRLIPFRTITQWQTIPAELWATDGQRVALLRQSGVDGLRRRRFAALLGSKTEPARRLMLLRVVIQTELINVECFGSAPRPRRFATTDPAGVCGRHFGSLSANSPPPTIGTWLPDILTPAASIRQSPHGNARREQHVTPDPANSGPDGQSTRRRSVIRDSGSTDVAM
jgi:hypothetical protein